MKRLACEAGLFNALILSSAGLTQERGSSRAGNSSDASEQEMRCNPINRSVATPATFVRSVAQLAKTSVLLCRFLRFFFYNLWRLLGLSDSPVTIGPQAMRRSAHTANTKNGEPMPRERASPADQTDRADDGPSDGEMIAAVRAGDVAAFEGLVKRYRRRLLNTAFARLGDADAAEDAVQEAFLSAFRSLATYDSRFSFRSWLWAILINQCRSQYRSQKRTEFVTGERKELDQSLSDEHVADVDQRLIRSDEQRLVAHLMQQLPTPQAEAIQLRFFGEMKYDEIAAALQCGVTTAKNRVRTGLERLSRLIQANK